MPAWANIDALAREPEADFSVQFSERLNKPIVVQSAIQKLKPWIFDVLFDFLIEPSQVILETDINKLKANVVGTLKNSAPTYANLNSILSKVLGQPEARFVRLNRAFRDRRICVAASNNIILPTLDALSAGQASLDVSSWPVISIDLR